MWKKIVAVVLFAVATFLAGCGHKEPVRYLVVQGYTQVDVVGSDQNKKAVHLGVTTDLELHSVEYNLDYTGMFRDCTTKDPITGGGAVSFAQDECPTPSKGSELEIVHESCNDFLDNKCTYAIYNEAYAGRRNVRVAFEVYPRIQ